MGFAHNEADEKCGGRTGGGGVGAGLKAGSPEGLAPQGF